MVPASLSEQAACHGAMINTWVSREGGYPKTSLWGLPHQDTLLRNGQAVGFHFCFLVFFDTPPRWTSPLLPHPPAVPASGQRALLQDRRRERLG